jgi:hypothetical protein
MDALTDIRSDVRGLATDSSINLMLYDDSFRKNFVERVVKGLLNSSLRRTALAKRIPFDQSAVAKLTQLLHASDTKVRVAALGLLDPMYLPLKQIEAFRQELAMDPVETIRWQVLELEQTSSISGS